MTPKGMGIALLFVAALCAFVAVERYETNAADVRAIQANPLAEGLVEMFGGTGIAEPAVPTETKYAAFVGVLALIGGVVLIRRRPPDASH